MENVKVIKVNEDSIMFSNDVELTSKHELECCETHYIDFSSVTTNDFEGLEFDLTSDNFFERIDGFGIALKPLFGFPVRIPGYGTNSGYYSSDLDIVLRNKNGIIASFDVSSCQKIEPY